MWLCSICSQLFGRGTERLCATKCGHVYHCDCILEWLETANSCPECREYCTSDEVIMIYLPLLNVVSPERIDEVKRLNDIQDKGLAVTQVIESKISEKIQANSTDTESLKFLKDICEPVNNIKDMFLSIEDVSATLTDINARGKDIMERHIEFKEEGQSLKILAEYSAKLQRDLDCYANNHRKIQTEAYENNLTNITLRCENNSLDCNLQILNGKVQYLNSCIELLRKEANDKQQIIKEEVEAKRKLACDLTEMNDKNKELLTKLETSEASLTPLLNTIKRLNMIINEKSELITLHTSRIKELNYTIEEMDKKLQTQVMESLVKSEEKDAIIREQKRSLSMYAMNCDELTEKLKALERKIYFYEAVIRGVVDRKGEPESPRVTRFIYASHERAEKKVEPQCSADEKLEKSEKLEKPEKSEK